MCSIRRARAKMDSFAQEVALVRDGRERHVVAAATRIAGADGSFDGTVLVVDDVTPLIRAQKVAAWREVARRLAHEIKNPLTPIQLSAERLRRKLQRRRRRRSRTWCRSAPTIIGEVESLKGLVDEFSQFARMPAPRAVPTAARVAQRHAGALRRAVRRGRVRAALRRRRPAVRLDPSR